MKGNSTGDALQGAGLAASAAGMGLAPFTGGTSLLPLALGSAGGLASLGGGFLSSIDDENNARAQQAHAMLQNTMANNAMQSALNSQPIGALRLPSNYSMNSYSNQ
jgi:hypothetical protein